MVDHIKKHNYHYINALLILISVVVTGLEITLLIFVLISINVGFRAYQNIYATNQKFEKLDNQFKYLKEVSSLDTERLKARYDKFQQILKNYLKRRCIWQHAIMLL
jgi:hypothetical protein